MKVCEKVGLGDDREDTEEEKLRGYTYLWHQKMVWLLRGMVKNLPLLRGARRS